MEKTFLDWVRLSSRIGWWAWAMCPHGTKLAPHPLARYGSLGAWVLECLGSFLQGLRFLPRSLERTAPAMGTGSGRHLDCTCCARSALHVAVRRQKKKELPSISAFFSLSPLPIQHSLRPLFVLASGFRRAYRGTWFCVAKHKRFSGRFLFPPWHQRRARSFCLRPSFSFISHCSTPVRSLRQPRGTRVNLRLSLETSSAFLPDRCCACPCESPRRTLHAGEPHSSLLLSQATFVPLAHLKSNTAGVHTEITYGESSTKPPGTFVSGVSFGPSLPVSSPSRYVRVLGPASMYVRCRSHALHAGGRDVHISCPPMRAPARSRPRHGHA
jgi:hypothetical protein